MGWAFKDVDQSILSSYATISLHSLNEKITVNFGKSNFVFDIEGFYLSQISENLKSISEIQITRNDFDYIIREYLVHSGYQESFMALENEKGKSDIVAIENDEMYEDLRFYGETPRKDSIEDDIWRKYSGDDGLFREPSLRKRTLSFMVDRLNDEKDSKECNGDIFVIMNFIKERKIIQNMILEKEYDLALNYFESNFHIHRLKKEINWKKIILCLIVMKYIDLLKKNEYQEAFQLLYKLDRELWDRSITVVMYDTDKKIHEYSLEVNYFKIINSMLNLSIQKILYEIFRIFLYYSAMKMCLPQNFLSCSLMNKMSCCVTK